MKKLIAVVGVITLVMGSSLSVSAKDLTGKWGVGVNSSWLCPSDKDVENSLYVGGNIDYGVSEYLGIGVESGYRSSDVAADGVNYGKLKGVSIFGNMLLRIPTGENSRFNPYGVVGLGAIMWDFEESSVFKNSAASIDLKTSLAGKLGAGCDFFMTDHVALNFEGGYVWSRAEAETKVHGQTVAMDERVKTDYWQVGGGVKVYF